MTRIVERRLKREVGQVMTGHSGCFRKQAPHVVVKGMAPLMSQRPRAVHFGQVDDHSRGLVVRHRQSTMASGTERDGDAAVERHDFGIHIQRPGEVHKRVVRAVDVHLQCRLVPLAGLHAGALFSPPLSEPEGLEELLWLYVLAAAVVRALADDLFQPRASEFPVLEFLLYLGPERLLEVFLGSFPGLEPRRNLTPILEPAMAEPPLDGPHLNDVIVLVACCRLDDPYAPSPSSTARPSVLVNVLYFFLKLLYRASIEEFRCVHPLAVPEYACLVALCPSRHFSQGEETAACVLHLVLCPDVIEGVTDLFERLDIDIEIAV
ncbi:MAG: hypothetical protein BWX71_00592 [Deltaproteobacteria bacterium ADurb.Bin072]|nr:MAG: hypothetical protein BWX71_00592 [Deltaproteobacteria bacterium ADurb.Bin072]